jgi:phenylalanine-4-hydroxylase
MALAKEEMVVIAGRHGLDFQQIHPDLKQERLAEYKRILANRDVPYPISPERAAASFQKAAAGAPFEIGELSEEHIELGQYTNKQHYEEYSIEDHLSWACLIAEQQRTKHRYACREYLEGEEIFQIAGTNIPDFYLLNARIYQQTGWQLATVNTIIPAELFFTCHSHRFFPVTTFMRPIEQDYLQEPDIGHDVAGHVSTFTIPVVASLMKNHGTARDMIYEERDRRIEKVATEEDRARINAKADELLFYAQRIYWFTVEFGLVMQGNGVRCFGAGILSSPGETIYSIDSPEPNRILIDPSKDTDLLRLASTDYLISEFQKTYFVMESFPLLASLTPERIVETAKRASFLPHFTWREIVPGDRVLNIGKKMTSIQEKYYRLMANQPLDDSLKRTAIRNLRLSNLGLIKQDELARAFKVVPPEIPEAVTEWFSTREMQKLFESFPTPLPFLDSIKK